MPDNNLLEMTSDIVTAMLSNNSVPNDQLPALITSVYSALSNLGQVAPEPVADEKPVRAVTSRRSLADPNVLISMIDGKSYASLKRHIAANGYTPETYRESFGLKPDYPMVAPGYSERRRDIAKRLGLGRKAAVEAIPEVVADDPAPKRKVRRSRKADAAPQDTTGE